MTEQLKMGAFVLIGAAVLASVIAILGKVQLRPGYTFDIVFDDISGLDHDSPVRIAGVKVGKVLSFRITSRGRARVKVWLDRRFLVHQGCDVRVVSTGLIGTKYLQMGTGDPGKPLVKNGETIEGISSVSVEQILESLKPTEGQAPLGAELREIVENIRSITRKLDKGIRSESDVSSIIDNIKKSAANIRKFTDAFAGEGTDLAESMKKLPELVDTATQAFRSIDEMTGRISNSSGTIGTLINDESVAGEVKATVTNLKNATSSAKKVLDRMTAIKTYWDYNLRYNAGDGKFRNDLGIKIVPRKNKFYYLGVSNIREKNGSSYDVGESTGERIVAADAYLGRVFGPATVYGGLIKTSGGLGFSLKAAKFLSVGAKAYRFDRKVKDKTKPWVDVNARIRFASWLYANMGISDATESANFTAGLNLVYDDEDLPYLFGLGSIAASASK